MLPVCHAVVLQSTVPGQEQVWTTSPALAAVLTSSRLAAAVQVGKQPTRLERAAQQRMTSDALSPLPTKASTCRLFVRPPAASSFKHTPAHTRNSTCIAYGRGAVFSELATLS